MAGRLPRRSPKVRGPGTPLCENVAMKRAQRWSSASEEGPGHRKSPTGPFRRRRALRHLDSLAQHPAPELSPHAAVAHVRVLGEPGGGPDGRHDPSPRQLRSVLAGEATSVREPSGDESRLASDRLHAVPIDEPLGVSLQPVARPG
jgi:hypothetical protein